MITKMAKRLFRPKMGAALLLLLLLAVGCKKELTEIDRSETPAVQPQIGPNDIVIRYDLLPHKRTQCGTINNFYKEVLTKEIIDSLRATHPDAKIVPRVNCYESLCDRGSFTEFVDYMIDLKGYGLTFFPDSIFTMQRYPADSIKAQEQLNLAAHAKYGMCNSY